MSVFKYHAFIYFLQPPPWRTEQSCPCWQAWPSCSFFPVSSVISQLHYHSCPFPAILPHHSCPCYSCPCFHTLIVLSFLCPRCPVLTVLSWPSYTSCPVLAVLTKFIKKLNYSIRKSAFLKARVNRKSNCSLIIVNIWVILRDFSQA